MIIAALVVGTVCFSVGVVFTAAYWIDLIDEIRKEKK